MRWIVILVAISLGLPGALGAQQAKAPTLEDILDRLQTNLNHYDAGVPNFFCDEHIVSSQMQPEMRDQNTVVDSVFRLMRALKPDHSTSLVESREIQFVDGKPPASQHFDAPTMPSGAFEGGLALVSRDQAACMNYTLQRVNKSHPAGPYIVRFASVMAAQQPANCLLQENSKGRVVVDPASLQIIRLEVSTPHHLIIPGNSYTAPIVGRRDITVDYAPVSLGDETFWMPSAIIMRNTSGAGTFHMMVWSFRATYRNYHRLEVTSRILPGFATPAP